MALSKSSLSKQNTAFNLSLGAATELIETYLSEYDVNEEDRIAFSALLNRIRVIETVCSGWLKPELKVMQEKNKARKIPEESDRKIDEEKKVESIFPQEDLTNESKDESLLLQKDSKK